MGPDLHRREGDLDGSTPATSTYLCRSEGISTPVKNGVTQVRQIAAPSAPSPAPAAAAAVRAAARTGQRWTPSSTRPSLEVQCSVVTLDDLRALATYADGVTIHHAYPRRLVIETTPDMPIWRIAMGD
jgi:hypothetical protein